MRRHRPLHCFHEARTRELEDANLEWVSHADDAMPPPTAAERRQRPGRASAMALESRSTDSSRLHPTRRGTSDRHTGNREDTRWTSPVSYSPIPFYSEHSASTFDTSELPASVAPKAFYDGATMRNSVPSLRLDFVSSLSPATPHALPLSSRDGKEYRRAGQRSAHGPRSVSPASIDVEEYRQRFAAGRATSPSLHTRPLSTSDTPRPKHAAPVIPTSATCDAFRTHAPRAMNTSSVLPASYSRGSSATANVDAHLCNVRRYEWSRDLLRRHTRRAEEANVDEDGQAAPEETTTRNTHQQRLILSPLRDESTHASSYVVVQRPAVVHAAAYESPPPPADDDVTPRVRSLLGKVAGDSAPRRSSANFSSRSSTRRSSRTVSQQETEGSRTVSSSISRRSESAGGSATNGKRGAATRASSPPLARRSDATSDAEEYAVPPALPSVRASCNPPLSSVSSVHSPSHALDSLQKRHIKRDATTSTEVSTTMSEEEDMRGAENGTDSSRVSSTRMRSLFASVLHHVSTISRKSNDGGHRDDSHCVAAKPLAHSRKAPTSITSPLALQPPPPLTTMLDTKVTRSATQEARHKKSGALSAQAHSAQNRTSRATNGAASSVTAAVPRARSPSAAAIMEGGDPLVLRHTVDYLLAKARRLEQENEQLWKETHEWNPRRPMRLQEAPPPVISSSSENSRVRNGPVSADPVRVPARTTRSTTTVAATDTAPLRRTATINTRQSTSFTLREEEEVRTFVKRQRVSRAAGHSAVPSVVSASASRSDTSRSPSLTTPPEPARHVMMHRRHDVGTEPRHETPRPTTRSITVSSPSALVDSTATGNNTVRRSTEFAPEASAPADWPSALLLSPSRDAVVQRVERSVQHESVAPPSRHDAETFTSHIEVLPSRTHAGSQATGIMPLAASDLTCAALVPEGHLSTAATLAVTDARAASLLLSHPPCTPTPESASPDDSDHEEGRLSSRQRLQEQQQQSSQQPQQQSVAATPVASTVRSHRSMDSRRSLATMTAALTPPRVSTHPSRLQSGDVARTSSSCRQHHGISLEAQAAPQTSLVAGMSTSNASLGSVTRSSTHNKQVQTARIVSPAAEKEDGVDERREASGAATLFDSTTLSGAATNGSAERTSVIELHTAADYNYNTVRRLRAYCSSLESKRQELRRHVVRTSPNSKLGASHLLNASHRSVSRSGFSLPFAHDNVSTTIVPSLTSLPPLPPSTTAALSASSLLSRPLFTSEYADPEVDATLHDVDETSPMETMIVLREDGAGTVTKRVVDGSPTRVSDSVLLSRLFRVGSAAQQRSPSRASTALSRHGSVVESSLPQPNTRKSEASGDQVASTPTATSNDKPAPARATTSRSIVFPRSTFNAMSLPTNVQLSGTTRSISAGSWTTSERAAVSTVSPDVVPLRQPSPTRSVRGAFVSLGRCEALSPPTPPGSSETRGMPAVSAVPSVSRESSAESSHVGFRKEPIRVAAGEPGAASRESSVKVTPRFAVPAEKTELAVFENDVDILRKKAPREGDHATHAASTSPAATPAPPAAAAMWDPKLASPKASAAPTVWPAESKSQRFQLPGTDTEPPPDARESLNWSASELRPPQLMSPQLGLPTANAMGSLPPSETSDRAAKEQYRTLTHSRSDTLAANDENVGKHRGDAGTRHDEGNKLLDMPRESKNSGSVSSLSVSAREERKNSGEGGGCAGRAEEMPPLHLKGQHDSLTLVFEDKAATAQDVFKTALSPPGVSAKLTLEDVKGGDRGDDADSFHDSEVAAPHESQASQPMLIDHDLGANDPQHESEHTWATTTSIKPPHPSAPSPDVRSSSAASVNDVDGNRRRMREAGESGNESEMNEESGKDDMAVVDVSEASSRRYRLPLPPLQRPPMAPPRVIMVDPEDSSTSSGFSRSLHSFPTSSDSDEDAVVSQGEGEDDDGDAEEDNSLGPSAWF